MKHPLTPVNTTLPTGSASWLALEPRILFDGAAAATVDSLATEQLTQSQAEDSLSAANTTPLGPSSSAPTGEPKFNSSDQALFDALAAYDVSAARQEIVFVSPSVRDYEELLDGMSSNVEVVMLDPARDGVEQMAAVLAGRSGFDAIHIISHGAQAELTLGTARLTLESMNDVYADHLAAIGQALSEQADLLIYGCNFGDGDLGRQAASRLAELTEADVAASTDNTGHADLGGDWDLEHREGNIDTAVVLSDRATDKWMGLLAENILESYEPAFASMGDQAYEVKSDQAWGQTFSYDSPGASYTVNRIGVVLYQNFAAFPQVITVSLRSSWTGAVIASGQISSTSLGTTEAWVHIDLNTPATLTDNSTYYIRVDSNLPSGRVYVGVHDSGVYGNGDLINTSGVPETPKDMAFRIIETTANASPVISGLSGDNVAYAEGDGVVVIDQGMAATVSDADSSDFDSGTLTVSFAAGSDAAEDVLAIRNQGTAIGQIGVSGNTVTYGGMAIGSFAGGAGGSNLVVTLNANATPAAAQALVQNITYENTDTDNPTTGARTVRFILTDGDGGSSGSHDTTVTVSGVNDAPVNTVPGPQTVAEDTALALAGVSVVDVDGNLSTVQLAVANGTVTVTLQGGATISSGANGTSTLTVSGSLADINATLATLIYQGVLNYVGPDTLTMTSTDSNAVTDVDTAALTVTAVNDAPAGAPSVTGTPTEDQVLSADTSTISDADGLGSFNYQWQRNGVNIAGATAGTYLLDDADVGTNIRVVVSYTDVQGTAESLTTAAVGPVANVNDAPVITSNGGGAAASPSMAENQTVATTMVSADIDGGTAVYSIVGGADAALFAIDAATGALTFNAAPDFEVPTDAGANNVYDVTVQVADGNGGVDVQALSITVIDVVEGIPSTAFPPTVPPSLVSPPPTSLPGRPDPPGNSPSLPLVDVSALDNPQQISEAPIAVFLDRIDPVETVAPVSEVSGTSTAKNKNIAALSALHMGGPRGFADDKVASLVYKSSEKIPMAFNGQTTEREPVPLSEAFRRALGLVEGDLRRSIDDSERHQQFLIRAANIGGITLTAGVITWLLRSGFLLTSLAATMPAWRHFDPLPVVLVSDRKRRQRKVDMAAAADKEHKQFRGLKELLDKTGVDKGSHGKGRAT